jgi:protein-S-isoprenylcysteine O-methyltransferase Ste14
VDATKLRLFAAIVGILFGLGGTLTLFVASTLALAEVIGVIYATFAVAAVALTLAVICLFLFLRPFRSVEAEVDDMEEATAEALADLPFDTVRNLIQQRPITATAISLALGYSLIRNPQAAQRQVERFFFSML